MTHFLELLLVNVWFPLIWRIAFRNLKRKTFLYEKHSRLIECDKQDRILLLNAFEWRMQGCFHEKKAGSSAEKRVHRLPEEWCTVQIIVCKCIRRTVISANEFQSKPCSWPLFGFSIQKFHKKPLPNYSIGRFPTGMVMVTRAWLIHVRTTTDFYLHSSI